MFVISLLKFLFIVQFSKSTESSQLALQYVFKIDITDIKKKLRTYHEQNI